MGFATLRRSVAQPGLLERKAQLLPLSRPLLQALHTLILRNPFNNPSPPAPSPKRRGEPDQAFPFGSPSPLRGGVFVTVPQRPCVAARPAASRIRVRASASSFPFSVTTLASRDASSARASSRARSFFPSSCE